MPFLVFHLVFAPFSDDGDQNPPIDLMPLPGTQNRWILIHTDLRDPELPILTTYLHFLKLTIFYFNKSEPKLPAFLPCFIHFSPFLLVNVYRYSIHEVCNPKDLDGKLTKYSFA